MEESKSLDHSSLLKQNRVELENGVQARGRLKILREAATVAAGWSDFHDWIRFGSLVNAHYPSICLWCCVRMESLHVNSVG